MPYVVFVSLFLDFFFRKLESAHDRILKVKQVQLRRDLLYPQVRFRFLKHLKFKVHRSVHRKNILIYI